MHHLEKQGIMTKVYLLPGPSDTFLQKSPEIPRIFPVTEHVANEIISLPFLPGDFTRGNRFCY